MIFTDIHWSANCSALGVIGFVESGLVAVVIMGNTCLPESGLERFYLVLIGFLSFFGQIALTLAALFESAANIGLLRKAFDVVLAFIFQILFFQVSFTITLHNELILEGILSSVQFNCLYYLTK